MDAKQKLKDIAELIDDQVTLAIDTEFENSKHISPVINELLENSTTIAGYGGKRIRGAFLYYSYLMHGGTNLKEALKVTAAIELIHAYLLIHDDIMDQADLRRNFETLHNVYKKKYLQVNPHNLTNGYLRAQTLHFGEAIAINAGDILCHLGTKVLTDSKFPDKLKIKALSKLHRKILDTGYGQVIDVFGDISNVDEDYVLTVHLYKTGYYTYQLPLHLGAILAGADDHDLTALSSYAIPGGIAFQLQDDIIDLFGENTGKLPGTDIKEGKKTLLMIKAYENCSQKDKVILDNALGNKGLDEDTLETVKQIIIDSGSLQYSADMSKKLLHKSNREFKKLKKYDNEGSEFMLGINDYMLKRKL